MQSSAAYDHSFGRSQTTARGLLAYQVAWHLGIGASPISNESQLTVAFCVRVRLSGLLVSNSATDEASSRVTSGIVSIAADQLDCGAVFVRRCAEYTASVPPSPVAQAGKRQSTTAATSDRH
jgi:hypothetical protein